MQMSFIGPRPVTKEEIKTHYKEDAKNCFSVKPGITGLWQVSGRSDTDYETRIRLDKYYVTNWSLWLDFKILARTFYVVIFRKGAK